MHQNLIRKSGFFGAGLELANAMLTEYRLRHNLDVGSRANRLERKHNSHYDPWLAQHIDRLGRILRMDEGKNAMQHIGVDMNAFNYRGSSKVFGSCPLPNAKANKLGIARENNVEMTKQCQS